MAQAYNKFHDFGQTLLLGEINCSADTLSMYLSNTAPSQSADAAKTNLAEITNTGGNTAGGADTINTLAEDTTSGVWKVGCTSSLVWTSATANGVFPSFRYVVLYDDTTNTTTGDSYTDQLIAWWDYGSTVWGSAPGNGDTFTVTCTGSKLFTINSNS